MNVKPIWISQFQLNSILNKQLADSYLPNLVYNNTQLDNWGDSLTSGIMSGLHWDSNMLHNYTVKAGAAQWRKVLCNTIMWKRVTRRKGKGKNNKNRKAGDWRIYM